MTKYFLILAVLFVSGCASVSTVQRPNSYYNELNNKAASEPLFGGSGLSLADDEINRILNYRLALPVQNRIAILNLSNQNTWRNYSNDFTQLNESLVVGFIDKLKQSPRVYDASFLPSMLVPQQRTVTHLREAAARYQADLLLAYRANCHTFEKYRFIDPNETKAYCSVEAVLLDVRSGIVPFTIITSQQFTAKKQADDNNFNETIKKAELEAISKSLKETAVKLNEFLGSANTIQ